MRRNRGRPRMRFAKGVHMIIREWRGRVRPSNADAYPRHFREKVVPELRKVPGFVGAHLSRRQLGDQIEFLVLTRWQSMDAIRGFAGAYVVKCFTIPPLF